MGDVKMIIAVLFTSANCGIIVHNGDRRRYSCLIGQSRRTSL